MSEQQSRYSPGHVRDAIIHIMSLTSTPLSVKEIEKRVCQIVGPTPSSSVRSYLRLNTPDVFVREEHGVYRLREKGIDGIPREFSQTQTWLEPYRFGNATLVHADCFDWIEKQEPNTFHAVVTDPPLWAARIYAGATDEAAQRQRRCMENPSFI